MIVFIWHAWLEVPQQPFFVYHKTLVSYNTAAIKLVVMTTNDSGNRMTYKEKAEKQTENYSFNLPRTPYHISAHYVPTTLIFFSANQKAAFR